MSRGCGKTRIHTPSTVCAACNWALYRSALRSAPVEINGGGGRGQAHVLIMCGGKKTCAFASLKMCRLLLVIGATHGLIEGIKKIRKVCAG